MKFFKQLIITFLASCVLAVGAMAFEPQKDDQKQKPPPKQPQEVRKPDKPPPPPPSNSNKGDSGKRGGKP